MELLDFSKVKVSCRNCSLAELCLPHGLNRDELDRLDSAVRRTRPLHKGDYLFRPGDAATALYAVRSGSLKLFATLDNGDEQIIGFYLPGEILGLDGIETDAHRCTAVALETSSVCAMPHAELKAICKQVPSLQDQMFKLFSRELSSENELLLSITRRTAEERIAAFLVSLSARFQRIGYSPNEFKLSMSREEIGSYLGLTIETVSRVFSRLRDKGVIALNRRHVIVRDGARLHGLGHGVQSGTAPSRRSILQ
jgi:CRP/FNR family transcriptional regulator